MKFVRISLRATLACLFALSLAAAVAAQVKENDPIPKDVGDVHIETKPAGFPVVSDGKACGVTTLPGSPIRVTPGTHRVEILFLDWPSN